MTFEDATSIKAGGNNVSAVYVGGTLVWPSNFNYVIVRNTVAVHYSSGSQINAAGSNYAYFTADVRVQRGQYIIRTISDARLTPSFSSSAYFYVSGTEIHAYNRGQNEGGQLSISVNVSYGDGSVSSAGTVYQQANVKTDLTPTTERYYDTPTVTTEEVANSRFVTIDATSYKSSSNPAPASGGSTTLYWSAGHTERQKTVTPWTDVTTPHYTYTALNGQVLDGTPYVSDSGSTTTYGNPYGVEDTPTISGSATGFTRSGNTVSIANRGTTTGQARSVTYTATNGSASPMSVSIYQEANVIESTVTEPHFELQWAEDYGTTFPGEGGDFGVEYWSEQKTTYTYTSGATTESSSPVTTSIRGTKCTPSTGTADQGHYAFSIHVNRGGSSPGYVFVTLILGTETKASISKRQDAYVPPVQNVATFEPYIWANPPQGSPYVRGYVYYLLTIMSGSVSQATFTNVYLHWQVNGGLEQSLYLGNVSVSETTTEYGTLVPSSGATIPTFTSGVIKAWFTITGTGDFDTVNAGQNYYCEVTL